jgi:acyl CoA:acetate/3-ketoacid CoA transferase
VDKITLNEAKIRIREDEEVEKFIEAVKRVGYGARLKA